MQNEPCPAACFAPEKTAADGPRIRVGVSRLKDYADGIPDKVCRDYLDAAEKGGGEAVLLGWVTDEASALDALKAVDCLILTGGEDPDPALYGEAPAEALEPVNALRDASDFALTRAALALGMPVLAICRGLQVVNVALGGSLVQDIPSQLDTEICHLALTRDDTAFHAVRVADPGSLMAKAMGGAGRYTVNSFHHQCVKSPGEGLAVTAVSEDGIAEALEYARPEGRFLLGVQFHPERHAAAGEDRFLNLFRMLVGAAKARRSAD